MTLEEKSQNLFRCWLLRIVSRQAWFLTVNTSLNTGKAEKMFGQPATKASCVKTSEA